MKVREVVVCLSCDEIYPQTMNYCPRCEDKSFVELRQYFPPLEMITKESVLAQINREGRVLLRINREGAITTE